MFLFLQLRSAGGIDIPWSSGLYAICISKVTISVQESLEVATCTCCDVDVVLLYYDVAARPISVLSYPLYVLLSVASVYAGMHLQSVATLV
jgi:hypothetical protein